MGAAQLLEPAQFEVGLMADYSNDPLIMADSDGDRVAGVVDYQFTMHLLGAVGITSWLDLGVDLPLVLAQKGDWVPEELNASSIDPNVGLADIRLVLRFQLFSTATRYDPRGFSLGLQGGLFFPTGDSAAYRSDGVVRVEPRLLLDYAWSERGRVGANVGYQFRPKRTVVNVGLDDVLTFGVGAVIPVVDWLAVVPEFNGEISILADEIDSEEIPLEALLGVRIFPIDALWLGGGAGLGVNQGFGAPDFRWFAGLGYASQPVHDRDGDGYNDEEDSCPDEPEDFDGFEDGDGCPDPDNDEDGILDVDDACPDEPEDFDGFEDSDGCPDPDNDEDGILDVDDACPNEPEDFDGFEDGDGCPDPDNDGDRILDVDDACPNEPEVVNGFEDEDGCPDELTLVVPTCRAIELREAVYFDTDSDVIQARSFPMLDEVVALLQARPDIHLVSVEGHTDSRGSESHNLDLSQRRAASVVRYLVDHGVASSRLTSEGYGESRPIADNDTPEGRAQNRRVELNILEQEGCQDE